MPQNELLLDILHRGLLEIGQSFDRKTENHLIRYVNLISQCNRLYNLSSIRDTDTMVTRHLLDSLAILPYIEGQDIIDVGTGAGLPGIPLAIAMPERRFVLLDSNQKKIKFLQEVCHKLGLQNVRPICYRVEEYTAKPLFDAVVSRAFSTLPEFLNLSRHLVKSGGQFLAMKGVYPLTELQDVKLPFKMLEVYPLKIPGLNAERHVVDLSYEPQTQFETA
jgi:16S rRNA (guanine527-N7)-methyltransferase